MLQYKWVNIFVFAFWRFNVRISSPVGYKAILFADVREGSYKFIITLSFL